jgi:Fic family protein
MKLLEEYLIINNYADTEKAASKILEAASDQFLEYLLQEISQSSYDRLKARLANVRTPEERARIQQQIRDAETQQREKILANKPIRKRTRSSKSSVPSVITKPVENAKTKVKRFITRTIGGALIPF